MSTQDSAYLDIRDKFPERVLFAKCDGGICPICNPRPADLKRDFDLRFWRLFFKLLIVIGAGLIVLGYCTRAHAAAVVSADIPASTLPVPSHVKITVGGPATPPFPYRQPPPPTTAEQECAAFRLWYPAWKADLMCGLLGIDMIPYMVPAQRSTDALQFHLEGPGSFSKTIRTGTDKWGGETVRFAKGRGHPAEYWSIQTKAGVSVLFNENETFGATAWDDNQTYRGAHDASGYPTFEWGRSNAMPGAFNAQPAFELRTSYCGADKPDEIFYSGDTSGYVATVYDLTDLAKANADLGDRGEAAPEWFGISRELGQNPSILVMESDWAMGIRELYFYLKGAGLVSWRWQERDIATQVWRTTGGWNSERLVWETTPIRILDLCEKVAP